MNAKLVGKPIIGASGLEKLAKPRNVQPEGPSDTFPANPNDTFTPGDAPTQLGDNALLLRDDGFRQQGDNTFILGGDTLTQQQG